MRLSKATYYADFLVYPPLILALSNKVLAPATGWQRVDWLGACIAGVVCWIFAEYVLHRFVLHRVSFLHRMHDTHHDNPTALIGTPIWVSLAIVGSILLPFCHATEFDLASGVTSGLMLGYLWYITLHHVVHHWRIRHGTYLYRLKRRHARHHYASAPCNYGVTTGFWDRVFGTADSSVPAGSLSRATAKASLGGTRLLER